MASHLYSIGKGPSLPIEHSRNTLLFSSETNYSRQRCSTKKRERREWEHISSFPSGKQTNLLVAYKFQPVIEIGKCYCPNKFVHAAQTCASVLRADLESVHAPLLLPMPLKSCLWVDYQWTADGPSGTSVWIYLAVCMSKMFLIKPCFTIRVR